MAIAMMLLLCATQTLAAQHLHVHEGEHGCVLCAVVQQDDAPLPAAGTTAPSTATHTAAEADPIPALRETLRTRPPARAPPRR